MKSRACALKIIPEGKVFVMPYPSWPQYWMNNSGIYIKAEMLMMKWVVL